MSRHKLKFPFRVITEFRSVCTVLVFNSICQQSMKKDQQIATVFRIYHGDKQAHIMGHAEMFMKGVSEYVDMMVNEGTGVTLWDDTTDKDGVAREVILEMLHWQFGKILVAGDNITHDFLFKTYESKDKLVTARAAIRVAKKMMSLMRDAVKEHVCEFRD